MSATKVAMTTDEEIMELSVDANGDPVNIAIMGSSDEDIASCSSNNDEDDDVILLKTR
jgi:hypothetical protein